jgi:hypothetical protein
MTDNVTTKIKKILKTIQEALSNKKRKEEEIRKAYTKGKWKAKNNK